MDDVLLSQAEKVTRSLLESHFGGQASFPPNIGAETDEHGRLPVRRNRGRIRWGCEHH